MSDLHQLLHYPDPNIPDSAREQTLSRLRSRASSPARDRRHRRSSSPRRGAVRLGVAAGIAALGIAALVAVAPSATPGSGGVLDRAQAAVTFQPGEIVFISSTTAETGTSESGATRTITTNEQKWTADHGCVWRIRNTSPDGSVSFDEQSTRTTLRQYSSVDHKTIQKPRASAPTTCQDAPALDVRRLLSKAKRDPEHVRRIDTRTVNGHRVYHYEITYPPSDGNVASTRTFDLDAKTLLPVRTVDNIAGDRLGSSDPSGRWITVHRIVTDYHDIRTLPDTPTNRAKHMSIGTYPQQP